MTERLIAGGGWSLLVAVLLIVAFLGFVLFAAGKPRDVTGSGLSWKAWVGGAVVVLGLLFLLSRGVANLDYNACRDRSQVC